MLFYEIADGILTEVICNNPTILLHYTVVKIKHETTHSLHLLRFSTNQLALAAVPILKVSGPREDRIWCIRRDRSCRRGVTSPAA